MEFLAQYKFGTLSRLKKEQITASEWNIVHLLASLTAKKII